MGARELLVVARFEAAEIVRDPQIPFLLAGTVALLHVILLSGQRLDPTGALRVLVGLGPIVLLFLAGPRRGAAHEGAFQRILLTCPVTRADVFWGRALGLHAITLAYALLVAPAFALEVSIARDPWASAANGLLALFAFSTILIFLGLGLSGSRGAGGLALVAVAILASQRLSALVRLAPEGALRRASVFAIALIPTTMVGAVSDAAPLGSVAPWSLALGLVAGVLLVGLWSARRAGATHLPLAWGIGFSLVAAACITWTWSMNASLGPAAVADHADLAGASIDRLAPLALLALLPASVGFARRRRVRS